MSSSTIRMKWTVWRITRGAVGVVRLARRSAMTAENVA
uniref:Uncharacterized protein n=1 Tax=Arundo donax TaxID=35708 RepID=A0A0A9G0Y1_ARUDO